MDTFTPLSAVFGGLMIGASAALFLILNGRIAGVSGILGGLLPPSSGGIGWRAAFLAGLLLAPLVHAGLGGGERRGLAEHARLGVVGILPRGPALDGQRARAVVGEVGEVDVGAGLLDLRPVAAELRLGRGLLGLERADLLLRGDHAGIGALHGRLPLLQRRGRRLRLLDRAGAALGEVLVAGRVLLGEFQRRLGGGDLRLGHVDVGVLRLDLRVDVLDAGLVGGDLRLRLVEGDVVVALEDLEQDLAGLDVLVVGDRHVHQVAADLRLDRDAARVDEGVVGALVGMHVEQPVEEHPDAERDDREAAEQERDGVAPQDAGAPRAVVVILGVVSRLPVLRLGRVVGPLRAGLARGLAIGRAIGGRLGAAEIEHVAFARDGRAVGRPRARLVLGEVPLIVKHGKSSPDGPATRG